MIVCQLIDKLVTIYKQNTMPKLDTESQMGDYGELNMITITHFAFQSEIPDHTISGTVVNIFSTQSVVDSQHSKCFTVCSLEKNSTCT